MTDAIMTYRRGPSDFGVIVRHATHPERHLDVHHSVADASMPGVQPTRAHAAMPALTPSDVSFAPPRRPQALDPASVSSTPDARTPSGASAASHPEVILVKSGFKQVATRVREILFVEAARNYVRIHLETGPVFKSRVPIDRLALHLGRERFLRVHRGCLVNVDRIRAVTPMLGGRLLLTLSNGSKVTVARDRRRFVLAEIGSGVSQRA